jgi:hypothetical protein
VDEDGVTPSAAIADYLRRSVSVSDLASQIWSGRLIVAAAAIAGLAFGAYYVHHEGASYTATMRISPAEGDSAPSIGGSGGGGGAAGLLADLAGGGATQVPKFTQFLVAMGSEGVARQMDQKYHMTCRVYSGQCDARTGQWHIDIGLKEWLSALFARLGDLPDPNGPRTVADLAVYTGGAIGKDQNKQNSIVLLSYTHRKREFASEFLSRAVEETNNYIRELNRNNQRRYVQYLSDAAARSTNVEQRQAIDSLLLQQERQLMMTEVDGPYAAQVLDGPNVAPVNKVAKTLAICTFLGIVLGICIVLGGRFLPRRLRRW